MRLIQPVRSALEMSSELLDRVEIRRDRRGGEVTALEFLQHDLATMGHKTPPVTPTLPGRSSEAYAQRPPRQRLGPHGVGFSNRWSGPPRAASQPSREGRRGRDYPRKTVGLYRE